MSGGFDRVVAIWDVGEGYRKLSLKVPMSASDRGSELYSSVLSCWVLGAGDTTVGETDLNVPNGADAPVGKDRQGTNKFSAVVSDMENPQQSDVLETDSMGEPTVGGLGGPLGESGP